MITGRWETGGLIAGELCGGNEGAGCCGTLILGWSEEAR
jgi:hypothetical protein